MAEWLTVVEAAARARSSTRTVERWIARGLEVEWRTDETGQRYRVIELRLLLAWWRTTMQNSPVHFNRLRRIARDEGLPEPVRPVPALTSPKDDASSRKTTATEGSDEDAPARVIDPLADMTTLRGAAEYYALTEKLKDATPGCAGIAEFTADKVDAETAAMMADICAHCPMLARCEAFATASRPAAGFWAGQSWRKYDSSRDSRPDLAPASEAPGHAS